MAKFDGVQHVKPAHATTTGTHGLRAASLRASYEVCSGGWARARAARRTEAPHDQPCNSRAAFHWQTDKPYPARIIALGELVVGTCRQR